PSEQLLHDPVVVAGGGAGEQVVGEAEGDQVLDDDPVVAVGQLAGAHALLVGQDLDRGAVLVGAADHEHVVAAHSLEAREDVGGDPEPGYVPNVARPVGVGPGPRGQDVAFRRHATRLKGAAVGFARFS